MLRLVCGPSCSGKSTLIRGAQRARLLGAAESAPILYPANRQRPAGIDASDQILHYNILRRLDAQGLRQPFSDEDYSDYQGDPAWEMVRSLAVPKCAVVLVATRATLLVRARNRRWVDPLFRPGIFPARFPSAHWIELISAVDLNRLYRA